MNKRKIEIKGKFIGGQKTQICIPLVGNTKDQVMDEAQAILTSKPDLVEWRVDYFDDVEHTDKVLDLLTNLRKILSDYPIIFTCRTIVEGGYKQIDDTIRINLAKEAIKSKQIEIVDVELRYGEEIIKEIIGLAKKNKTYVIVSNHDFKTTPSKETIVKILLKAKSFGADIPKIAVMPNSMKDVLTLLTATFEVAEKSQTPIITMSMASKGILTRVSGSLFGSAITFASGKASSAPGQIPISELRTMIEILHKY